MDHLSIFAPDGTRTRYKIGKNELRIGRGSVADVVLQDTHVSKLHAELKRTKAGYVLRDLQSTNGTYVNDHRLIGSKLLESGDRVRLGKSVLILNPERSDRVSLGDRVFRTSQETVAFPAASLDWSDPDLVIAPGPADRTDKWTAPSPSRIEPRGGGALRTSGDVVTEVNRRLFLFRPLPEILDEVMKIADEAIGFERGVLLLFDRGEPRAAAWRVREGEDSVALNVSRGICDHVRRSREAVLTVDAAHDERFPRRDSIPDLGIRSVMCVPLLVNDEVIGLIYVDSRRQAGLFQEHALRLLTLLANLAAVKIETARLIEQQVDHARVEDEMREAAAIQRRLLPTEAPAIRGYDLEGSTFPCFQVGGDYFDFIGLPGGRLAVVLSDVAGKGLPAALLMSNFHACINVLAGLGQPLAEMTERLNLHLCSFMPDNKYITYFCGVLDPDGHTLTFVNAGHVPALLVRRDATVERLELRDTLPLGCFPTFSCKAETVSLETGDALVCYSDGVTEAVNERDEMFGEDRLTAVVRRSIGRPSGEIVTQVLAAVDEHCGSGRHQDDITVVVLRRTV